MTGPPEVGRASARAGLCLAGLFGVALLAVYHETAWSMVAIWTRSETFAHGFLILPISLWLIWSLREEIDQFCPEPQPLVALLLVPLGAGWLLAWLVDVAVVQQLALVATVIVGCWAILGNAMGRLLAFPLAYLFFAVPIGEGLIAPMMEYTATSTVWMIEMTGIPVYREGLHFALPSGRWSVVEACSGVRYIIASVTVGTLYAYLTYRSFSRRVIFVIVSAIVPIFANSARAYIIVMLGHLSGMKIATGADHLVYGWFFFGVVIFLLFWLGSFFREDHLPLGSERTRRHDTGGSSLASVIGIAGLATILALVAPVLASTVFATAVIKDQDPIALPAAEKPWAAARFSNWWWRPPVRFAGQQSAYYEKDGMITGLYVQYLDGFFEQAEVIGSSALFAYEESYEQVVRQEKIPVRLSGAEVLVDEAQLRGRGSELLAWSWYLIGDTSTSNNYQAKLEEVKARLGLGAPGSYRIVITTPLSVSIDATRARLQQFLDQHNPHLGEILQQRAEALQ